MVQSWWASVRAESGFSSLVDYASSHNLVNVLKYLLANDMIDAYTARGVDDACRLGHQDVLTWWNNSELDILRTDEAIHAAIDNNDAEAVEWIYFASHYEELDFMFKVPERAFKAGATKVLDKFADLEFNWDWCEDTEWQKVATEMIDLGHLHVLDWMHYEIPSMYLSLDPDHQYRYGYGNTFSDRDYYEYDDGGKEFWAHVIEYASKGNNVEALAFLARLLSSRKNLWTCPKKWASVAGTDPDDERAVLKRLKWWFDSDYELSYNPDECIEAATKLGLHRIAKWWRKVSK
ncbi:hypothetical protein H9P43_007908 [Blastocladiella emersonii ATCC 22665]|nr:hypothetical protein H9P43_007908 [Blastocladiella emersonii ATCC 22665]